MTEKVLGKITFAEYGRYTDRPFLFGLQLGFSLNGGCGIFDGARYTFNISDSCKWDLIDKLNTEDELLNHLNKTLSDANASYVSQLVGKPVEITLNGNTFSDFRILTEVI